MKKKKGFIVLRIIKNILKFFVRIVSALMPLISLIFAYLLILLGLGVMITPTKIPGLGPTSRLILGFIFICIGGAILKRKDIEATARIWHRAEN